VRPTRVLICYRTRRRIGAYLDDALDPEAARTTADHLATCARCAAESRALTRLRLLVQAVPQPQDPDWTGFWPGVVRGIEDAKRAPVRRRARSARLRWAFGGALAAAFVASVTLWQLAPWQSPVGKITEDPVVVRSADTADPGATVMVYSTPERDLTVVWVFGLDRSQ
jgi:anti-sigma factor RsiW